MVPQLTPTGRLRWASAGDGAAAFGSPSPRIAFEADWREALFTLAAQKVQAQDLPSVRYWRQFAERYITRLCHVPADREHFELERPAAADCARWMSAAPPMPGGEYLCEETLQGIWSHLNDWVREAAIADGGLTALLQKRAPQWHQVGRVCFHLAENKHDGERPFAFMTTYASGFGAAGRLRRLPLHRALAQYAGARNRAALITLLAPVQQAAEACPWVQDLVDSGDIYRPMAWPAGAPMGCCAACRSWRRAGWWCNCRIGGANGPAPR